jgi:uncharacterized protein (DUF4213/DUF364 family)
MALIDDLIGAVEYPDAVAKHVRVGVTWTAVVSEKFGLAKTYGIPSARSVHIRDAGKLTGKPAAELAQYATSWNQLEASIGVAALNSMIEPKGVIEENALDVFRNKAVGKRAVMVGRFPVELDELIDTAEDFCIIEMNPALVDVEEQVLPVMAVPTVLPAAEVVAITGSTLITQSLEYYLSLCRQAYTIILGPSTPMSEVLFRYGADVVASTEIINPDVVLSVLSQGGGRLHPSTLGDDIRYRMMTKPEH